jgi:hypothetical protein
MLRFDAIPAAVRELLERLSPAPALAPFALAGGTSLALRFGHRLSVDLDFFTRESFHPESLLAALPLVDAAVVGRSENSLTLDASGTKLDFLRHAYPLLGPVESIDGVHLLSIPDVAAMKLNAIADRGSKKDFFDLCELARTHSLSTMLEWFERKHRNSDRFIVVRSLAWFEDAELEPDPVSLSGQSWDKVKEKISSLVRSLG